MVSHHTDNLPLWLPFETKNPHIPTCGLGHGNLLPFQGKGWVHGGGGSVKASRPSSYLFCHLLCGISISWPQMAATTWQTPTQSPGLGPIVYPSGKFLLPLQCLLGAPMPWFQPWPLRHSCCLSQGQHHNHPFMHLFLTCSGSVWGQDQDFPSLCPHSSSVVPFSSRLQSFPASGSFPMSQFFASKYWSFSFSISPSNEYSVLISYRNELCSSQLLWLQATAFSAALEWCFAQAPLPVLPLIHCATSGKLLSQFLLL